MARRYTYVCTLSWGGDEPTAEVEVEVSYTLTPGCPEQGPSYASGGQPAEYPAIDDIRLEKVEGKPRPWGMYSGYIANEDDEFATECIEKIEGSERHLEAMINEASERDASDEDDARERRHEDQRDRALGGVG